MKLNVSLLLNTTIAIEIPMIVELASGFSTLEESLIAFTLTFVWLSLQKVNGAKYAAFVLLIPYSIGIFSTIYQSNLEFSYRLLLEVLLYGNRQLTNEKTLDIFSNFYCPISILGFTLSKRMGLIDDLIRYGLWQHGTVRRITDLILRVLTLIDLASELFFRITIGLEARYIDIGSWRKKLKKFKLWAPDLFRSMILSELARNDYLIATGIRIHKMRSNKEKGVLWIEIAAIFLLVVTIILLIFTH
uniref:Uncharacterized protein n=1 Tax=Candidatus Kentrum sp. MB TaxID=2138164 RepID=A0A451BAA2_9GAMM|nr:MAG: hypothetical protein BECKMB1821I_GA0114274_101538 [Candidatus Kentron sp. MB]VFK75205.1 MAG: hypothetical protein BECKMB1821H_GA0114242_101738 [Candidatus Kentron sp. MB]